MLGNDASCQLESSVENLDAWFQAVARGSMESKQIAGLSTVRPNGSGNGGRQPSKRSLSWRRSLDPIQGSWENKGRNHFVLAHSAPGALGKLVAQNDGSVNPGIDSGASPFEAPYKPL